MGQLAPKIPKKMSKILLPREDKSLPKSSSETDLNDFTSHVSCLIMSVQDGTDLLKSSFWRSNMIRKWICGVLAASLPK